MKYSDLSPAQQLHVSNLTSGGMPLADAIKHVTTKAAAAVDTTDGEPAKLSASQRKEALAEEILALGGEVPESGSVAKFEEALADAKAAAETKEDEAQDLM